MESHEPLCFQILRDDQQQLSARRLSAISRAILFCHRAQELEHQVRRQDRGDLTRTVVERRDFDNVAADQLQAGEATHETLRFVAGESSTSGVPVPGANAGSTRVDVEGRAPAR